MVYGLVLTPGQGESIIGDGVGITHCRTFQRKPDGARWSADLLLGVRGTPWNPKGEGHELDDGAIRGYTGIGLEAPEVPAQAVRASNVDPGEKRIYITKRMVKKYGATLGCRGCLESGFDHLESCRTRITARIRDDPEESWRLRDVDGSTQGAQQEPGGDGEQDAPHGNGASSSGGPPAEVSMDDDQVGPANSECEQSDTEMDHNRTVDDPGIEHAVTGQGSPKKPRIESLRHENGKQKVNC